MNEFTDSSGAAIPVELVSERIAAGDAFADNAADYSFRDRTGQVVKVKGDKVGEAIGAGYELLSPDDARFEGTRKENESGLNFVRTMAERGASVASGGLTDLAAGLASPELASEMRDRARAAPGGAALGEFGGALVPLSAAGKLAGATSKVARLVKPTTPIGRMALRAAAEAAPFALEGAIYGGTSTAGQLALNQEAITAEKVLAGAGQGALYGSIGGIGAGLASRGLNRIARNLDEAAEAIASKAKAASEKAGGKARAIDSLQISQRHLKGKVARNAQKLDAALDEVNRDFLGYEMKTGPMKGKRIFHDARDPVDLLDDVTHAWNETGREVQKFRDAADEIGRAAPENLPDAMSLNKRLDDVVGAISSDPYAGRAAKRIARKIEKDHLEPLRQWRDRGAADPIEQAQAVGVANIAEPAKDISPRLRQAYEGATPEQAQAIATGQAPIGSTGPIPPVKLELGEMGPRVVEGHGRIAAAQAAGAQDVLATVTKPDGSTWTGPISINGRPVTPDGAPSLSQLDRMRQGVGDALAAAKRAGKKDEIRALSQVYSEFTTTIDDTIEKTLAPQGIGLAEYREAKRVYSSLSLVKNAVDDLKFKQAAGGAKVARPESDAGFGYALMSLLSGNFGQAATQAARAVGANMLGDSMAGVLNGSAVRATNMLELGAKAIAKGSRVAAAEMPRAASSGLRYAMRVRPEETVEQLREITSSPQAMMRYAAARTEQIVEQYPQLGAQVQSLIMGDVQHLAATAPAAFREHAAQLTPLARSKALYSHPDVQKWLARAEALENPEATVRALIDGELPLEAIETLKLRRPGMWNELRTGVAAAIAEQPDEVPFKRRVFLGTAFEFPADYSMLPAVTAELQAPPVAAEAAQAQGGSPGKVSVSTDGMLTPTQRLEDF